MERNKSIKLLAFSKFDLVETISVLSGHCTIGTHSSRLKNLVNANCQSCMDKGERSGPYHHHYSTFG